MDKCPYCGAKKDLIKKIYTNNNSCSTEFYCSKCHQYFYSIKNFGDNHPVFPSDPRWAKEKEEHNNFKDMGLIPKINTNNLTDLFIDLWELLNKKEEKNNEK